MNDLRTASPADRIGRPLLVCGHPKTGTSLLVSLLDSHPDVLAFPEETKYFRRIHGHSEFFDADALLRRTRVGRLSVDRITSVNHGPDYTAVDAERFEDALRAELARPLEPRDLLPAVMLAYGAACGQGTRRFWVEKTPLHEHHLDEALRLWPDLVAIYIARDPRDVYTSFRKKRIGRGKPLSVANFALRLRRSLAAWDAFAAREPSRCLLVRYEDLALEPRDATERIAAFLGIEWQPVLLEPTLAGLSWGGNSMYQETHHEVSSRPIGRYARSLAPREVRALEHLLAATFDRFGWQRDYGGVAGGRLGDWVAIARSALR